MKKIVLAFVVAVATAAAANAQTAAKAPKPAAQAKAAPAEKATTVKGEVVSTDAAAKTITIKDAAGASSTLTATGAAVAALAKVKAGDMVSVTERDSNAVRIAKVKAPGAKKPAKAAKK